MITMIYLVHLLKVVILLMAGIHHLVVDIEFTHQIELLKVQQFMHIGQQIVHLPLLLLNIPLLMIVMVVLVVHLKH